MQQPLPNLAQARAAAADECAAKARKREGRPKGEKMETLAMEVFEKPCQPGAEAPVGRKKTGASASG
jgi:hypothetical protein